MTAPTFGSGRFRDPVTGRFISAASVAGSYRGTSGGGSAAGYSPTQGVRLEWNGPQIERRIRRAARAALTEALTEAVTIAKAIVPVDTGRLRGSIAMTPPQDGPGQQFGSFGSNPDPGYAIYVELGTYKMQSRPFLRPAADIAFKKLRGRLEARVRREIGYPGGL